MQYIDCNYSSFRYPAGPLNLHAKTNEKDDTMTPVTPLPYSHEFYHTLPGIMEADDVARNTAVADIMASEIGQLFIKHKVENELGVILLHNHHAISPIERLVQVGNAVVRWNISVPSPHLQSLFPISWRFVQGGLAPYEFRYSASPERAPPVLASNRYAEFLVQLADMLAQHDLLDVLGLCALDDRDVKCPAAVETSSGRTNITLNVDIDPAEPGPDDSIEVIWQFGQKKGMFCLNFCSFVLLLLTVPPPRSNGRPYCLQRVQNDLQKKARLTCQDPSNDTFLRTFSSSK